MSLEQDIHLYFRTKMLKAIQDTMQFAEIAEADKGETISTVMSTVFFELIRLSVAINMKEKDWLQMCTLAYRQMYSQAKISLSEHE